MSKTARQLNWLSLAAAILLPVIVTSIAYALYEMKVYPNGYWRYYKSATEAGMSGAVMGALTGLGPSALVTALYLLSSMKKAGLITKAFSRTALLSFFIPFLLVAASYFAAAYSALQVQEFGAPPHTANDYVRELLLSSVFGAIAGFVGINILMLRRLEH